MSHKFKQDISCFDCCSFNLDAISYNWIFFVIDYKSRKINKSYSILLIGSYIYDLITSFLLWFSYNTWDDNPFRNTKNEFLMLSIFFPILMAVIGYFCLSQFKKSTNENAQIQQAKDELLEKYPQIASDVVKLFL